MKQLLATLLIFLLITPVSAEDGSKLWLRASHKSDAAIVTNAKGSTINIAEQELLNQWKGGEVHLKINKSNKAFRNSSPDSYIIKKQKEGHILIESSSQQGLLYGTYHLIRLQETNKIKEELNIIETLMP